MDRHGVELGVFFRKVKINISSFVGQNSGSLFCAQDLFLVLVGRMHQGMALTRGSAQISEIWICEMLISIFINEAL